MKKIESIVKITFLLSLFLGWGLIARPQGAPPPPDGGHGQSGNQPSNGGGGAPLDGGLTILLGMGALWGGKKTLQSIQKQ